MKKKKMPVQLQKFQQEVRQDVSEVIQSEYQHIYGNPCEPVPRKIVDGVIAIATRRILKEDSKITQKKFMHAVQQVCREQMPPHMSN